MYAVNSSAENININPLIEPIYIENEGNSEQNYVKIYQSMCAIDMYQFPFDEHNCTMTFASQSYSDDELALVFRSSANVSLKAYLENVQWNLLTAGAIRDCRILDDDSNWCNLTFSSSVTFTLNAGHLICTRT